ncbi:hypothetical protein PRIPAC_82738 [Pristionchus pacificus]|uniref:Uncharacterized protein n=1 Tax=Pristionchus pacificus TaxID=54126 RepID=A0A2A6C3R1_PRIPA|nr:hypothetical protein PRIPAC_82738 [Pristionchus pacificus]|eukprot:PDM72815.1 hypothetical protein PRIPAC_39249 [Pristionchus pacificus]
MPPIIVLFVLGCVSAHFDDFELDERFLRHLHRDDIKEREYSGDDVRDGQRIHFLAQLQRREEERGEMKEENSNDDSFSFPSLSRNRRSTCHEYGRLRRHFNSLKYLQCENGEWIVKNSPPGTEFDFVHQTFVKRGTIYKL